MRPEKKGQFVGGVAGIIVGGALAYLLWGFSPPGGILILAGFAIGGLIGFNLGRNKQSGSGKESSSL